MNGKSEGDAQIFDRLIDQWIVRTEAEVSRLPLPSDAEIQRRVERLENRSASAEEYETRKKQSGLNDAEIRRIAASQLYLDNYLDSRFRPAAQIDPKTIEDFYLNRLCPGQVPWARASIVGERARLHPGSLGAEGNQ